MQEIVSFIVKGIFSFHFSFSQVWIHENIGKVSMVLFSGRNGLVVCLRLLFSSNVVVRFQIARLLNGLIGDRKLL